MVRSEHNSRLTYIYTRYGLNNLRRDAKSLMRSGSALTIQVHEPRCDFSSHASSNIMLVHIEAIVTVTVISVRSLDIFYKACINFCAVLLYGAYYIKRACIMAVLASKEYNIPTICLATLSQGSYFTVLATGYIKVMYTLLLCIIPHYFSLRIGKARVKVYTHGVEAALNNMGSLQIYTLANYCKSKSHEHVG